MNPHVKKMVAFCVRAFFFLFFVVRIVLFVVVPHIAIVLGFLVVSHLFLPAEETELEECQAVAGDLDRVTEHLGKKLEECQSPQGAFSDGYRQGWCEAANDGAEKVAACVAEAKDELPPRRFFDPVHVDVALVECEELRNDAEGEAAYCQKRLDAMTQLVSACAADPDKCRAVLKGSEK